MDSQATTPFSYCPSTVFLPVHSHFANARWNDVATNQHYLLKKILTASSLGELEETTKTPLYYVDEDYSAGLEIQ